MAGFTEDGIVVFDTWESEEAFQQFSESELAGRKKSELQWLQLGTDTEERLRQIPCHQGDRQSVVDPSRCGLRRTS